MTQLFGLANNTKWSELQRFMSTLGSKAPYWRTQATNGFIYPESGWDGDWTYHFRIGGYRCIEWCEMSPRGTPESLTFDEITAVCKRIGFEFECQGNRVKIMGYRKL
jgi:hypothetical protein